jgi:IS5 family transposase
MLRGRRKRRAWGERERALYIRRRWRVKGTQGTAKTLHGLARAIRRGLANMRIQALLTAATTNLKRLAKTPGPAVRDLLAMLIPAQASAA